MEKNNFDNINDTEFALDVSKLKQVELIQDALDQDGKYSPEFSKLLKVHKLNEDEYRKLKEILGRAPTLAELGVFSAMWSEHCSYKSSRVHLGRFPTEGKQVVVGPGENAGVVHLSGDLCAAFKMESHNHPSYIEPYQGAATGVGGILRDVFCMGARPIANLNALRFGSKDHNKTAWLLANAVKGIGDYGNCVGIPTVGGNLSFDSSYNGNCLVNAMTVGLIHKDRIFKGYASGIGNLVIYVGSATGRDGIHGATMASDSFESKDASERSAIQVGDPFMEKLLLEATLEALEKTW
ncbi:MAG: AIR synthase related protein [Bdellovibrionota bacterium]